jgi:hypothetical protein
MTPMHLLIAIVGLGALIQFLTRGTSLLILAQALTWDISPAPRDAWSLDPVGQTSVELADRPGGHTGRAD